MRWKYGFILFLLTIISESGAAQVFMTKNGFVGFYSKTPFEDIQGENNQVYAVLDAASHRIALAMLLRGFIFPKELMQEHFNENYVESDKYPKATFSGSYIGDVDFTKPETYQVVIKGELTLHGVVKSIETTAQIDVKTDQISGTSVFKLKPEDFQIEIPGIVRDKIAKEINVKIQTLWIRTK
jgi:polyisoprenoid-binding protein YceI